MRGVLKVGGVEKKHTELTTTESVSTIGSWNAILPEVEYLTPFSGITIEREGVEVFGGRLAIPLTSFGSGGSKLKVRGYDYSILLTDYLTPASSIVDTDTDTTLTTILSLTDFNLSVDSVFSYISEATALDTACEFLEFDFSGTCIEFLASDERTIEVDTDANTLPAGPEFRCSFWADTGTITRFYIFYKTGGNLVYRFSEDCGATWSAEQATGPIALGSDVWSLVWYDSKVYLFLEDAGGNTDFYRGTIADLTGVVTLALIAGNVFANPIRAGPIFDNRGYIYVIEETGGNGDLWNSWNDGVNWANLLTTTEVAIYLLPRAADLGDFWIVEHDTGNNDLELWYWDQDIMGNVLDSKIDDLTNLGHISGAQHADYTIELAWTDDGIDLFYAWKTEAGAWSAVQNVTPAGVNFGDQSFQISADRGVCAYLFAMNAGGFQVRRVKSGVAGSWVALGAIGPGLAAANFAQSPQTGICDGELAIFGVTLDTDDDVWFSLLDPYGIRIDRGDTTGWFRTDGQTAGGAFVKWGYCIATGIELDDTLWSVLDNANVVLASGQGVPFDIDVAGVDPSETTIKFLVDMTDTGTDPYVWEIDFSERVDEVTMDVDHEDCYTALRKWSSLSGGDVWIEKDDGTYTVHVAETRGSDKSAQVVLKNAKTGLYPDVLPNIKVVDKLDDWESYRNKVYMIGSGTGGARVEVEVFNQPEVDLYGSHWLCFRDQDLATDAMARTRAAEILTNRGTVVRRLNVEFLDTYDAGVIEIGDTVTVAAEFGDDDATKINEAMRIISLTRTWDTGEHVSAQLVSEVKASELYSHLVKVSDLERWITV